MPELGIHYMEILYAHKDSITFDIPMSEKTIESIPIMPVALMLGCIGAVVGLVVGIFYAAIFSAIFSAVPPPSTGINLGFLNILLGAGALIAGPIAGFVGGLVQGLVYAGLYNFFAPRIGGIKVRVKEESHPLP